MSGATFRGGRVANRAAAINVAALHLPERLRSTMQGTLLRGVCVCVTDCTEYLVYPSLPSIMNRDAWINAVGSFSLMGDMTSGEHSNRDDMAEEADRVPGRPRCWPRCLCVCSSRLQIPESVSQAGQVDLTSKQVSEHVVITQRGFEGYDRT